MESGNKRFCDGDVFIFYLSMAFKNNDVKDGGVMVYKEWIMDIKEIQKMGNSELLKKYGHLHVIEGSNNVYNKPFDNDIYMDIELMKNEIMVRMSQRRAIDYTNNFN